MWRVLLLFLVLCTPAIADDAEFTHFLLERHNAVRVERGLPKLTWSKELEQAAQSHADRMAKNNLLQHQRLSNIISQGWTMMGENIASGQRTEDEVMAAWMKSPGHRNNVLNRNYRYVGFGMTMGKRGTLFWCVLFGNK